MYIPSSFAETDQEQLARFIDKYAFGLLVSDHKGRPFATHIPFFYEPGSHRLSGHLATANPHADLLSTTQEILVIFQGPQGYISPSWYSQPGVPTWNYTAVHVYGKIKLFDDPDKLKSLIDRLSNRYEAPLKTAWVPSYDDQLLQHIVGIEIDVTEIQGKFKLSQNKSEEERLNIAAELEIIGNQNLADNMRNTHKK